MQQTLMNAPSLVENYLMTRVSSNLQTYQAYSSIIEYQGMKHTTLKSLVSCIAYEMNFL